jgi:predicted nucleic acid-binding protein
MKAYFDSSVILRRALDEPGAIRNWSQWQQVISSELMRVEVFRAIDRLRILRELPDAQVPEMIDSVRRLIGGIHQIAMDAGVLQRAAAPFASVVGTLDAIHIATALHWIQDQEETLVFVTHDVQQALAARLAGFQVQT